MKIELSKKMFVLAVTTIGAFLCLISACKKSNIAEAIHVQKARVNSAEYLANLRAYKKSDHAIAFGWFGSSGGASSNGQKYSGIPDSVDIVSLWGGYPDDAGWADLHQVQANKGTKFVGVSFSENKILGSLPQNNESIKILAKGIADEINKRGLDGFDIDHEPNVSGKPDDWSFFNSQVTMTLFLKELSVYFGPKSGTGKLLIVDGEIGLLTSEAIGYLDYAVAQAYNTGNPESLQSRFNTLNGCPSKKFVVTENFESYWATGGIPYNDPVRGTIPSLLGMAYWNPTQGRKGGMGTYLMQYEFPLDPDYKFMRRAIQIQNPAVK